MTKSTASYVSSQTANGTAYLGFQGVLSAQLNAVLTKTADSGQISTFNQTPVATVRDYEVFRFSDSLQATAPIFIKVNWAMDPTTYTFMNVTVGTSTNGAGTLGGVSVGPLALFGYNPTSGATRYVYASSDGSQLVFVSNLQAQAATSGDQLSAIVIERTRDADGTPNASGYMIYHWKSLGEGPAVGFNSYQATYGRFNDINAQQPGIAYDYGVMVPNIANVTSGLSGTTAYAFPVYGYITQITGASKALMLGFANDFPKETVVGLTHYGTTMNFLPLPQVGAVVPYMSTATATAQRTMSPLLRWE